MTHTLLRFKVKACLALIACPLLLANCGDDEPSGPPIPGGPDWLNQYIEQRVFSLPRNSVYPAIYVKKAQYQDGTVYIVVGCQCSEGSSKIFDSNGIQLCISGGITGGQTCSEIFDNLSGEQEIWRDPR